MLRDVSKKSGSHQRPGVSHGGYAAIPSVEGIPDIRPPSLKNIGTILAAPIPTNTNPNKTSGNQEVQITMPIPAAAIRLPPTTMILLLSLSTILSPDNRMTAIATEKAA